MELCFTPAGQELVSIQEPVDARAIWSNADYGPIVSGRLGCSAARPFEPREYVDIPDGLNLFEFQAFMQEERAEELGVLIRDGLVVVESSDVRPRSPKAVYDSNGMRINRLEQRVWQSMKAEYVRLVHELRDKLPDFEPGSELCNVSRYSRRLVIPVSEYPEVNFVSLILGPRGMTHAMLQEETECLIEFRGSGMQATGQSPEESAMPAHMYIEGSSKTAVNKAVTILSAYIDPEDSRFSAVSRGVDQSVLSELAGGKPSFKLDRPMSRSHNESHSVNQRGSLKPTFEGLDPEGQYPSTVVQCSKCGCAGHIAFDCLVEDDQGAQESCGASRKEETVEIPSHMIGAFIGTGGSTIKQIIADTGATKLIVDQSAIDRGSLLCRVSIVGSGSSRLKARTAITDWVEKQSALQRSKVGLESDPANKESEMLNYFAMYLNKS